MRLSPELNEVLNLQIQHEFLNMLKYKQIESYFEDLRLKNLAKIFHDQADEEYGHATKFIDYLNSRVGGRVEIKEIPSPALIIDSLVDVARLYFITEEETTASIENILSLVESSNSYIDRPFIEEMLAIQVIEEDEADEFLKKSTMVKDLLIYDATLEG